MNILFRVSGGKAPKKQLGFGHAYRIINLAQYFPKKSLFFLLEDYGGLKNLFSNHNLHNVYQIKKDVPLEDDIKKTTDIIKKEKIDILIIDKFKLKIQYIKKIRKYVKVIVISDLNILNFPADRVFNGFVGFRKKIYYNKYGAKCYLGPSYQILNDKFSRIKKIKKKYNLLVTFGGLDENKITAQFLRALEFYDPGFSIKIILGPGTQKLQIPKEKFKSKIHVVQETKNMAKEIASAEYGLCSGGITSYEFAALKVPFAIIPQVSHQIKTAKEWEKLEIGINLGLINKSTYTKIIKFLQQIESKSLHLHHNSGLVDGLGGQRVAKEIKNLL